MKNNDIENKVSEFLQKHPKFTEEAAQAFAETYYPLEVGGSLGSKFSERIFRSWILKALEGKIYEPDKKKSFTFNLKLDGEEIKTDKKPDLYIKRRDNKEVLIEFKCNIDNIEKDLFKFAFCDEKYKKILFIWEKQNRSSNRKSEKSSYLKILEAFKNNKHYGFDFVYLPIYQAKNKKDLTVGLEDSFKELIEKILG